MNSNNWKAVARDTMKSTLRIGLAIVVMELLLRLSCFNLITNHLTVLDSSDSIPSVVYKVSAILKILSFGFKYIVFYGVTFLINNLVGMRTTALPRCVAMMHTSKELWRSVESIMF